MANNITYVKQKSGVIYAYENLGTWDKVNKKPICRRPVFGDIVDYFVNVIFVNFKFSQNIFLPFI